MMKLLSAEDSALLYRHLAAAARHKHSYAKLFEVLGQDPEFFSEDVPVASVMLEALGEDNSLPDAMARLPELFSAATVELVRQADRLGKLAETLEVIADEQDRLATAGRAVKNATAWPLTLLGIGGIVMALIMIFVIPAFEELYSSFGADMPAPTLILMNLSKFFVAYGWVLAMIAVGVWVALRRKLIPRRMVLFVERVFMAVPFIRNFMIRGFWAQLLRWLAVCGSRPELLPPVLAHLKATIRLQIFHGVLDQLAERLASGQTLGRALDLLPPLPRRMALQIQLGELTGEMDDWIAQALYTAEAELDSARTRYERGIFLSAYLVIGFTIGITVIAMYLPIFKMAQLA